MSDIHNQTILCSTKTNDTVEVVEVEKSEAAFRVRIDARILAGATIFLIKV